VREHHLEDWHLHHWYPNRTIDSFGGDRLIGTIYVDVVRTGSIVRHCPPLPVIAPDPKDWLAEYHEHFRRLERLLFIFAMIRQDCGYSQGFNQLAAIIYYVIVTGLPDPLPGDRPSLDVCEALTYSCFSQLLCVDGYGKSLATVYAHSSGDHRRVDFFLKEFDTKLRRLCRPPAAILVHHEIGPIYYAIRWFSLLFSQDWDLPLILVIWDNLLCHSGRDFVQYLQCLGLAHLEVRASELSMTDYGKTIEAVQRKCVKEDELTAVLASAKKFASSQGSRVTSPPPIRRAPNSSPVSRFPAFFQIFKKSTPASQVEPEVQ
jgi:hypothetical protein